MATDPLPYISFFSRELKQNPLVALVLLLSALSGLLGWVVYAQNERIQALQNEKLELTTTLLREQIRTDRKIDIIEEELRKNRELLESTTNFKKYVSPNR